MEQLKMERNANQAPAVIFPDGYTMRDFKPGDEEAWCACCIDGQLGVTEQTKTQFDKIMTTDPRVKTENIFLLIAPNGDAAGTITYQSGNTDDEGYIHMVGLDKKYRGKRLSLPLVNFAVNKIIEDSKKRILLTTDDWRLSGIKAYLNAGFSPMIECEETAERWSKVLEKLSL